MSNFDDEKFAELKAAFKREFGRIEPIDRLHPLTENKDLQLEYKTELIRTFNDIVTFLSESAKQSSAQRVHCIDQINPFVEKVKIAFIKLKLKYEWPKSALTPITYTKVTGETEKEKDIFEQEKFDSLSDDFVKTVAECT